MCAGSGHPLLLTSTSQGSGGFVWSLVTKTVCLQPTCSPDAGASLYCSHAPLPPQIQTALFMWRKHFQAGPASGPFEILIYQTWPHHSNTTSPPEVHKTSVNTIFFFAQEVQFSGEMTLFGVRINSNSCLKLPVFYF